VNEVLIADVTKVRDIHPEYKIESVPSLLQFSQDRLITIYKGCNGKEFYESVFSGNRPAYKAGDRKPAKRVTVYSTPGCSWCTTLKSYLREKNIIFTDIDVSADQKAAEAMVRRSGQQGVPQTDINGEIIVGFDKTKIDRLLEKGK
jgi:glutaredoxin-like YruB-family protein